MTTESDTELVALQEALLGSYSIERQLGRGGMGTVYLARDVTLDRPVALKVLHPSLAASERARTAFLGEARTAAKLSHPHIVPIFAIENRGIFTCLVMEFIQGETLGARIRHRGPLQPDEAERLIREVAWALGYAHAHGVVHRDITLENILIERGSGRALLADFGLAGPTADEAGSPRFGTPGFLAPEVIRGEAASPQSDLYALGVVGWTAITGKPPFVAESSAQLLAKHLVQPLPEFGGRPSGVSRRLVSAVESCLQKDAAGRPADATAFLALLERAPEPVTLAAPLHAWFTRWEVVAPFYAILTPLIFVMLPKLPATYRPTTMALVLYFTGLLKLAGALLVPVMLQAGFEIHSLRKLRAAGFGLDDLRAAWHLNTDRLAREREREGLRPLASRVITDLTVIGLVVCAVMYLVLVPFVLPRLSQWTQIGVTLFKLADAVPAIATFCMLGIAIGLFSPGFRFKPRGLVRSALTGFWHSRIAGQLSRVSSIAQARGIASGTLHRPTALVLGLAIEDIWRAMPPALRDGLGDMPSLARTLQTSAAELQELVKQLQPSRAQGTGDASVDATLLQTEVALKARHQETIGMLEQLRLQLLRLVATRQPTQELTQQLDAARDLEQVLLREVAGHDSVRRHLKRSKVPDHTATPSTPTPVAA